MDSSKLPWHYGNDLGCIERAAIGVQQVVDSGGFAYTYWPWQEHFGESFANYYDGNTPDKMKKSNGWGAVDFNRFPKLNYYWLKNAIFASMAVKPGVALQSHWNLSGTQTVTAYSNCESVELFLNNVSKGVRTPSGTSKRCQWTGIVWANGTIRVKGLNASGDSVCADSKTTAGAASKIILTRDMAITTPAGFTFPIKANGSDCAFIQAQICDASGNWCPLAANELTFSVSGQGLLLGGTDFLVDTLQGTGWHAPGDDNLKAEGGLAKVAVRSTFTAGSVTVTASASGLASGTVTFATIPVDTFSTSIESHMKVSFKPVGGITERTFKTAGGRFLFPDVFIGKTVLVSIYDMSGRHLANSIVKRNSFDFKKELGLCGGVFILRVKELF